MPEDHMDYDFVKSLRTDCTMYAVVLLMAERDALGGE